MRTLEKNKTKLWIVQIVGQSEQKDDNGFFTGDISLTFSEPSMVKMNIYPSDGKIVRQIFGTDVNYDMVGISNDIILDKDSLIFLEEPVENFDTTYDFKVHSIKKSLNSIAYGLRSRI